LQQLLRRVYVGVDRSCGVQTKARERALVKKERVFELQCDAAVDEGVLDVAELVS
jgi:hypothetical protein